MHLDVARNFVPKDQVLKLIDVMAMYKLNKFHFHLTDDEGWRLEIPGLPELTEVNRPFPHYAPVSKHKEMKTRLGWTISYKSLYFVHPSLELVPLFTGMRERSIKIT